MLNPLLLSKSQSRVAVANNCNIPINYNTTANWVQNCWTRHHSGPAGYTAIEVTFVNGLISTNSEQSSYYDFVLRAGIFVGGQFTQLLFDGLTDVTISKDWGIAVGKANVFIPPNTDFYITNRRVASDGGVTGSYKVITNSGGNTYRQDGIINGTDNTRDYTMGVGLAYGARAGTAVVSGGAVTSIPIDSNNRGTGYGAGVNLAMWYGPAGPSQPASLYTGSGVTGFGSVSGGQLSSITVSTGGSGHTTGAAPQAFIGGTGSPTTGFGTTTATYGPSMISGIPRYRKPSVLLLGDSVAAGYGSVDSIGDLNASFGLYEQALINRAGVSINKMAVSGESAVGWVTTKTQQLNFMDAQIARGVRPTHVVIALGINDFLTNNNTDVVSSTQGNINAIATIWRNRGAKIIITTIPPCNTTSSGSNKFTTIVEQTPVLVSGSSANYQVGGRVEQYNSAMLSGAIANDGIIDISSYCRDATTTSAWRVDTYGGTTALCAVDGIHPSVGCGIPYLAANMALPVFN